MYGVLGVMLVGLVLIDIENLGGFVDFFIGWVLFCFKDSVFGIEVIGLVLVGLWEFFVIGKFKCLLCGFYIDILGIDKKY